MGNDLQGTGFTATHGAAPVAGNRGTEPSLPVAPNFLHYFLARDPLKGTGRNLRERPMIHGHSLQLADIDGDGNLDIFAAEMAKWRKQKTEADHPDATA